jgi:signal transduction histidine kinase
VWDIEWMSAMSSSIRARTTAVFSLAVTLLMAVACGSLIAYARHISEREAKDTLSGALAKITHELMDEHDENAARLIAEEQEDVRPEDISFFLAGKDGKVIFGPGRVSSMEQLANPHLWRTVREPVGEGWLVAALPWGKTEASLRSLEVTLWLLGIFVVLIATVGAWVLVGRTLSPIGRLSNQANTATIDGLRVRLEEPSQDAEIVGLVATLNGLLERLSETAAVKGRFYSAASHELRTPLQALSGHLELALDRSRTPQEYRAAIVEAYQQTRRLIKLTRSLLLLYQLESADQPSPEPADLAAICRETLAEFESLAAERNVRVTEELPDRAPFIAPPTHAEVLVRNLIENAVRYAGSEVKVWMEDQALRIFNDADLPSDWDPQSLFEPFTRVDSSRNSATGGTGLGLAICRAIADLNGWTVILAREAAGVMATLVIPRQ